VQPPTEPTPGTPRLEPGTTCALPPIAYREGHTLSVCRPVPWLERLWRLEPDAGKLARPVLRGGGDREVISLPDLVSAPDNLVPTLPAGARDPTDQEALAMSRRQRKLPPAFVLLSCFAAVVVMGFPGYQGGAGTIAQAERAAAFPTFAIEAIPYLQGGAYNKAFGINGNGHVAGYSDTSTSLHAFLYRDGKVKDLGVPQGFTSSVAWGVNAHEQFAVNVDSPTSSQHAYFASVKNTIVSWRPLLGTGKKPVTAWVAAINDSGDVSGTIFPNGKPQRATLWRKSQSFAPSILNIPATATAAAGLDAERDVAVNSSQASGGFNPRGLVWERSHKLARLRGLQGGDTDVWALVRTGGSSPMILAVGDAITKKGQPHAAAWRIKPSASSGVGSVNVIDLGHLKGYPRATAYAVNRRGWVVGSSSLLTQSGEDERAFLYLNGHMRDLNELIPTPSDWILQRAVAINSKGEIAGYGVFHGQYTSFLLTPH
jgi:probable HAF family extracellular repeat protein